MDDQQKTNDINKAYSSEPWWYDFRGFLILTFAYKSTLLSQIRHFAINMGDQHLEVAIGSGTFFELLLKYRKWRKMPLRNIVGFDYAEKMLQGAKARFHNEKNISLLKADAAQMPFPDEKFDTIGCANSIHSFPEIQKSIQECYRVLKKGGEFNGNCLLYPGGNQLSMWIARRINIWGQRKGILHRPYMVNEIRFFLESAGFKITKENVTGNCYNFVAKKTDRLAA